MIVNKRYHLTYCSNIHPGEEWDVVFENIKNYIPKIKAKLSPNKPFGIGLRLSNTASNELFQQQRLYEFQKWLQENNAYVFTINGFPYGNFHRDKVKDDVHKPDWTTAERRNYTIRLARILEVLLPENVEGGISTSPLSYKPWLKSKQETAEAFKSGALNYIEVAAELDTIFRKTGKLIHLDIEPEPDGLIENIKEFIDFYNNQLLPEGIAFFKHKHISAIEAVEIIKRHIQLCYDVCHFSLAYEQPRFVFNQLRKAGIKVGKIQISSALKAIITEFETDRKIIAESFSAFAESTYLHQVVERDKNNRLYHYPDLPAALENILQSNAVEWRTHFHVPLFVEDYGRLSSTQEDIRSVLKILKKEPVSQHLEIETYTWEVLPLNLKSPIEESIKREYEWVLKQLK